jgi:hypothetical protein
MTSILKIKAQSEIIPRIQYMVLECFSATKSRRDVFPIELIVLLILWGMELKEQNLVA